MPFKHVVLEVFNIHNSYTSHTLYLHKKGLRCSKGLQSSKGFTRSIHFARSKCKVHTATKACIRYYWSMPLKGLEHNSGSSGACLWKVWSMPLEGLEHCYWRLGALLLEAGGIAIGSWGHCSWKLEALLLEYKSMPFWGTKACLLGVQKHACLDTKASRA